jgi:putative ABC transport system ATP-binding protein
MLVELDEVSFSHRDTPVLRNFCLAIPEGSHSLLIGASGSGKSTLINLICGFLTPRSGSVRIAGELISSAPESRRDTIRKRTIGVVFQTLRLVSALDIMGNLQLAARLAGRPASPDRVRQVLSRLGIENKADALPRHLSQGEAQRAAIARALIAQPRLLIADEPTSALDDRNTAVVIDLLLELAEAERATLLIATHDARLRERFGRVIELGAPTERAA